MPRSFTQVVEPSGLQTGSLPPALYRLLDPSANVDLPTAQWVHQQNTLVALALLQADCLACAQPLHLHCGCGADAALFALPYQEVQRLAIRWGLQS